jgi:hypothetical protein
LAILRAVLLCGLPIESLAIIMLMSVHFHIAELVTGIVGVAFIGWLLLASIVYECHANPDSAN